MFGYVIANTDDLSEEEKQRYRQVYCGLCQELGKRHGQISRFSLNYDMTFLVLMLSSLYEPDEEQGDMRCVVHPLKKHLFSTSRYTEYAADMTVALTYYKCMDDWNDEHKLTGRCYARALKKAYLSVREQWPRQCNAIEACMTELTQIEKNEGSPDQALNCFGNLMAELFVYKEDVWSKPLRQFGSCLGRFIYLMDSVLDYEDDQKSGSYNLVAAAGKMPKEMEEVMMIQIGAATEIFEKLPLVQDAHLLRSVIYAGVWQKYRTKAARPGKEKDHGTGSL